MSPKWITLAVPVLLASVAHAEVYSCTTADGHTIFGVDPPAECKDRDIRVMKSDGSVAGVLPAPLPPEQRRERGAADKKRRQQEEQERERKDRQIPLYRETLQQGEQI